MDKRSKDCTCDFPKGTHYTGTNHANWCPAHKRLEAKHFRRDAVIEEESRYADKDAYGRWAAGVGPKPDFVKED